MFFCSFAYSEDFNLICEGERKVRNLGGKKFNVTDFESKSLMLNEVGGLGSLEHVSFVEFH